MAVDRSPGDFGSKLREARERRGISLRQIANATKISVVPLEALERNDVSRLPGGIFSRAFLRAYAIEVGLDPELTIQEFIAQFPHDSVTAGHPVAARAVEDHQAVESDRQMATTFLRLIAVSIPIVGAVLYFTMRGPATVPAAVDTSAPVTASEQAPPPQASTEVPAALPPSSALGGNPDAAETTTANPDVLSVGLLATRECWLSVTVDGARVVERLFQAGERTSVDVRQELIITAGDAAAITLTLNGADAKPLGGDGQVVTAKLNPSNFRSFLAGR